MLPVQCPFELELKGVYDQVCLIHSHSIKPLASTAKSCISTIKSCNSTIEYPERGVPGEGRNAHAHCRGRGVREVSATCDGDGVSETDGSLVLPEILRPAPSEGINARLIVARGNILATNST